MDKKSVFFSICVPWISNNSHNTTKLIWFYNALQYNTLVYKYNSKTHSAPTQHNNTFHPQPPSAKNKAKRK